MWEAASTAWRLKASLAGARVELCGRLVRPRRELAHRPAGLQMQKRCSRRALELRVENVDSGALGGSLVLLIVLNAAAYCC